MPTVFPHALPIDALLGAIVSALNESQAVVLEAAPGAGKTTRVPLTLLDTLAASRGDIWVAEPRRVAARLAARFVAQQRGCKLGDEVGYSVRFEDKTSAQTRLRFVTEGILLQRLSQSSGAPPAVVVLDEFHERHLDTDLNLMFARQALRDHPATKLVVMSATLDAQPIADFLGGCPLLTSEGRAYPLTVEYTVRADDRPLPVRVSSAVKAHLRQSELGNVLAFLPGIADIRKAQQSLEPSLGELGIDVFPLYGDMPLDAQARAVGPSTRRKVVLATNVAESSVTVAGVTAVIDSGLARVAEHSPWTGRQSLQLREVSQASARQRAGRAGRTAPGHVIRLYSESNFRARPAHDAPEVQRLDLAESMLLLLSRQLSTAPNAWLSPPNEAALEGAQVLLERLGLANDRGLTALGKRARRLPLPPRLARLVLEGQRLGLADDACLVAALLGERDLSTRDSPRSRDTISGYECDIDRSMDRFRQAQQERFRAGAVQRLGLQPARVDAVRRVHQTLLQQLRRTGQPEQGTAHTQSVAHGLGLALLAAFPDRIARRRKPGGSELTLCSGHSARLSEDSAVHSAQLLVCVAAEDRGRGSRVTLASPVEPDWLLEQHGDEIECVDELNWDNERERAFENSIMRYGALVLEESLSKANPSADAAKLVARAALAQKANLFGKKSTLEPLLARIALLAEQMPELNLAAGEATGVDSLIEDASQSATSLAELRALDWDQLLTSRLNSDQQRALREHAPMSVQLAQGRQVDVQYEAGKPPWIASRLQDFFGMSTGPAICRSRLPLTLHLLAPNRRAVQITSDLSGFWERHYPAIRKELRRRYPRHAWSEDPLVADGVFRRRKKT